MRGVEFVVGSVKLMVLGRNLCLSISTVLGLYVDGARWSKKVDRLEVGAGL